MTHTGEEEQEAPREDEGNRYGTIRTVFVLKQSCWLCCLGCLHSSNVSHFHLFLRGKTLPFQELSKNGHVRWGEPRLSWSQRFVPLEATLGLASGGPSMRRPDKTFGGILRQGFPWKWLSYMSGCPNLNSAFVCMFLLFLIPVIFLSVCLITFLSHFAVPCLPLCFVFLYRRSWFISLSIFIFKISLFPLIPLITKFSVLCLSYMWNILS